MTLTRRTHATSLSDDELILLDVMFWGGAYYRLLRRSIFRDQWNCPPHNLDDAELKKVLKQLVHSDVLRAERVDGEWRLSLTTQGGQLWEAERKPRWEKYATAGHRDLRSGKVLLTICSTSPQTREELWTIGCQTGCFAYSSGRIRRATIRNCCLIQWKQLTPVYSLPAVLDDCWTEHEDLRAYEERRTWWSSAWEIDKFW